MTEDNYTSPDKASFNQAQYQQIRINDLILRIDRMNTNALVHNPAFNDYNYKVVFNDLCSVLLTISAKLTDTERKEMISMKETISNLVTTKQVFSNFRNSSGKKQTMFYPKNWEEINKNLFEFRMRLETLMDVHGFGNPTKDDPRRSVYKGV